MTIYIVACLYVAIFIFFFFLHHHLPTLKSVHVGTILQGEEGGNKMVKYHLSNFLHVLYCDVFIYNFCLDQVFAHMGQNK